jgi:hypothetical protein
MNLFLFIFACFDVRFSFAGCGLRHRMHLQRLLAFPVPQAGEVRSDPPLPPPLTSVAQLSFECRRHILLQ